MSKFNYTTVDRIFSMLRSQLTLQDLTESRIVDWIGEAIDFMDMPEIQENVVSILKVNNHETCVPSGMKYVFQIGKLNDNYLSDNCKPLEKKEEGCDVVKSCLNILDDSTSNADILDSYFHKNNRVVMDDMTSFPWKILNWLESTYYQRRFEPVRPTSNTFFNAIVCDHSLYTKNCCKEEYTIVGTVERKFRFSFKEGVVAVSHSRLALDPETGYPYIPDTGSHLAAINYYVKWKLAESEMWAGREGFKSIADDSEKKWLKYVGQANNLAKMPSTIDDYQDLMDQSTFLLPRRDLYNNFFSDLNRQENFKFKYRK